MNAGADFCFSLKRLLVRRIVAAFNPRHFAPSQEAVMASKGRTAAAVVLLGITLIVGVILGAQAGQRGGVAGSIIGVWRVVGVTPTGPNQMANENPQPGLRIFTQRHYSFVPVNTSKPRGEVPRGGAVPDNDVAGALRSPAAHAGTYETNGNELTLQATVGSKPNVTGVVVQTFRLEGSDTLWLTEKWTSGGGAVQNPTTVRLTRVE
jgi:hypothetical protein